MGPQARRSSGRRRTAITKYTDDPFEAMGLSPNDSGSEPPAARETRASESSDEFTMGGKDRGETVSNHEEEVEAGPLEEASEAEQGSGEESIFEEKVIKRRRRMEDIEIDREKTHSRGLLNLTAHSSKFMQLKYSFGCGPRDLLPMVHTRENWTGALDATFPSKESIKRAEKGPSYGTGTTFGIERDLLARESSAGWDWYYDESTEAPFRKRQRLEQLGRDAAQGYLPFDKDTDHTVLIGPSNDQKTYKLGRGEGFDIGDAWETRHVKNSDKPAEQLPSQQRVRDGWILNMGNKIRTLSWAPNCPDTQYLAVSVPISDRQREATIKPDSQTAPAFTPSPPYPAAIQIWSFESREDNGLRRLDMSVEPRLRLVLCTDSGDIDQLCWCPQARDRRPADDAGDSFNIGLLAGIWGDGTVKILDVALSKGANDTELMRVKTPAFDAKPTTTLCTCVTWLSPSDIAVGCANGFVAIWSISSLTACERPSRENNANPPPYIYTQIHHTYIFSIASAYPSYPEIIATSDVDGQSRQTSLLDHSADTVDAPRLRMGFGQLVYSPFLLSFASLSEGGSIRLLQLRRFFSITSMLKPGSTASVIAPCSWFHPCILAGHASGTVVATNPFRKLLLSKEKLWQQAWFRHEWVPGKQRREATSDNEPGAVEQAGVSKFYDGFKAEAPSVSRRMFSKLPITIFEEKTGVTALAWNPNRPCAGWACAGLGCGLIRVEDLSH